MSGISTVTSFNSYNRQSTIVEFSLLRFFQQVLECLLCARHCSGRWECSGEQASHKSSHSKFIFFRGRLQREALNIIAKKIVNDVGSRCSVRGKIEPIERDGYAVSERREWMGAWRTELSVSVTHWRGVELGSTGTC